MRNKTSYGRKLYKSTSLPRNFKTRFILFFGPNEGRNVKRACIVSRPKGDKREKKDVRVAHCVFTHPSYAFLCRIHHHISRILIQPDRGTAITSAYRCKQLLLFYFNGYNNTIVPIKSGLSWDFYNS